MRKYKVRFYSELLDKKGDFFRKVCRKEFYIYNDSWEDADKIAKEKLSLFREIEHDEKINYWIDTIGSMAIINY